MVHGCDAVEGHDSMMTKLAIKIIYAKRLHGAGDAK
jgi:hypothetical protein